MLKRLNNQNVAFVLVEFYLANNFNYVTELKYKIWCVFLPPLLGKNDSNVRVFFKLLYKHEPLYNIRSEKFSGIDKKIWIKFIKEFGLRIKKNK